METVNENPPTPPPPPPPAGDGRRLTRATDDKVVSGLCGGLGRYFGIDPVVFRIAFVVLALAGGSGVLAYLVGWVLVPDDAGRSAGADRLGGARNQNLVAAVLGGLGFLLLMDQLTGGDDGADVPVGLALLGIGALVLWSRRDGDAAPPPPPPAPPSPSPAPGGPVGGAWTAPPTPTPAAPPPPPPPAGPLEATAPLAPPPPPPPADPPEATAPFTPPPSPPTPPPPSRPADPAPRSVLVPVTLSLLAIAAGVLALAGVSLQTSLAVLLLVTGGALVVGASRGRARWLIPVGLILAVGLMGATAVGDIPVRGGAGERVYRPASLVEVLSPYRLAAGSLTVDLAGLDPTELNPVAATEVVASVGAGDLVLVVPEGVGVDLDAHVGVGELELLGRSWGGADLGQRLVESEPAGGGRLVVRARVGLGHLEVRRAPA